MIYETDTDLLKIWNGTAWRIMGASTPTNGTVLQVVQGVTSTLVSNSTTTLADTGLTATITPKSSSSKVLILVNHNSCAKGNGLANNSLSMVLLRGATSIKTLTDALGFTDSATTLIFGTHATVLDSPSTTSATTYKTQFRNFQAGASVTVQAQSVESTITLMEIAA